MPVDSSQPASFVQGVHDELKTIRAIHFTLLLTTAAITYVIYINWSPVVELRQQLEQFQALGEGLTRPEMEQKPFALEQVHPNIASRFTPGIERSLAQMFGEPVWLGKHFVKKIDWLYRMHDTTSGYLHGVDTQTISDIRQYIDSGVWYIDVPAGFTGNVDNARTRLSGKRGGDTGKVFLAWDIDILSFPESGNPGSAAITMVTYYPGSDQDWPPLDATTATVRWLQRGDSIRSDSSWFAREFPNVEPYWDSIASMNPVQAITWAKQKEDHALDGQKLNVFGVSVESKGIRIVGPLATLVIFIYLWAHIGHIRREVRLRGSGLMRSMPGISPWIGTMGHRLHQVLTFLTLVASLYGGVALPGWRLWGLSTLSHLFLGGIGAVVAFILADRAHDLAGMYTNMRLVRTWRERRSERKKLEREGTLLGSVEAIKESESKERRKKEKREARREWLHVGVAVLQHMTRGAKKVLRRSHG